MLEYYFGQSGNINWECESQKEIDTYCNTYIPWNMKIIRDVESIIWTYLLTWSYANISIGIYIYNVFTDLYVHL